MPKVITGAGLQEFIETGKHETLAPQKDAKAKEAPALEVKADAPKIDVKPAEAETKPEVKPEEDGLEPEDKDLSEIIRKKIGKKHRAMKEAQEAAQDAETFAKGQYERARLAEERSASLAKELEEARKASVAAKVDEAKAPDEKDPKYLVDGQFNWKQFSSDQAEYISDKKIRDYEARQFEAREAAEKAEAAKRFREKADKIANFQEKLGTTQVLFPNAVLEYITESEDGPEITMYLVDNPETADRISKLRPIKAIAEIGKIVKGFAVPAKAVESPQPAAPPVDRGGAPPPITPITGTGTGTINTDPARMSFRELREYERAKRKKH